MKKLFSLVFFWLSASGASYSQGLMEYYLLQMGNCNTPVAFVPDSLLPQAGLVEVNLTLLNQFLVPVFDTSLSLTDPGLFEYLGAVTFDPADAAGQSTYHAFRLLYDGYDSFENELLFAMLSLSYDEWNYYTFSAHKKCQECSLAMARISYAFLYNLLPPLIIGSYAFLWDGYDADFHSLSPYRQAALVQAMNWLLDREATLEDYALVLDPAEQGNAAVPGAFGEHSLPSCMVKTELMSFFQNIPSQYMHEINDPEWLPAFNQQLLEVSNSGCLGGNSFYLNVYRDSANRYLTRFIPLNAGWPTISSMMVIEDDSINRAIAYSYHHQGFPGIVYEGNGEFSYTNGFVPADDPGFFFPGMELTANKDTLYQGHLGIFTLMPPGLGTYIFQVNGVTRQSGPGNIFSTNTLADGDKIRVIIFNYEDSCLYQALKTVRVVSPCSTEAAGCSPELDGFFASALPAADPLAAADPFNADSSLLCYWQAFSGTPGLGQTTDSVHSADRYASLVCSSHPSGRQDGLVTAPYRSLAFQPGGRYQARFYARLDPAPDSTAISPARMLICLLDSSWARNEITHGDYPAVPSEHALMLNDTVVFYADRSWMHYSCTFTIPEESAYTRLALLPRLVPDTQAAEKTAILQLTGISLSGCCDPGEPMAVSDVYTSNFSSGGSGFGSYAGWNDSTLVISTGWDGINPPGPGNHLYFKKKLIVDTHTIIQQAWLLFGDLAAIEVLPGQHLWIHQSQLGGCMQWEGIIVHPGGHLHVDPDVHIREAWPLVSDPNSAWLREF